MISVLGVPLVQHSSSSVYQYGGGSQPNAWIWQQLFGTPVRSKYIGRVEQSGQVSNRNKPEKWYNSLPKYNLKWVQEPVKVADKHISMLDHLYGIQKRSAAAARKITTPVSNVPDVPTEYKILLVSRPTCDQHDIV